MKRLLVLVLVTMLLAGGAQAQDSENPLILWIRGDLYSVLSPADAPRQITTNGTISGPQIAPDGRTVAYKAAAQVGLDALDRIQAEGVIADFDLPGDIYLFNVSGRVPTLLAAQPADASLLAQGTPDKAIIRSAPVWSPDGSRLAWTEYDYPGGKPRLVVYNRVGGALSTLATDIPAPLVQGAAPSLKWGTGGIAVNLSVDATSEQDFVFYADDGRWLSSPRIAPVENDPALDYVWVESASGSGAMLGLIYQSARWIFIDPQTGVAQAAAQLPYLTTRQDGSLKLGFGIDQSKGFYWEVLGQTAAAPGAPGQVTLSPSGQAVAFTGYPSSGAVSIWQNGDATAIPNTGSNLDELQVGVLLWGYTEWRVG
jgi:hypothetical protein